ncbi:MAG: T9SS type A sorting domain-containing protein [Bacteroidia bacterium]
MSIKEILFPSLLFLTWVALDAQELHKITAIGGESNIQNMRTAPDGQGNLFVLAEYLGPVNLNPWSVQPAIYPTLSGGPSSYFIARYGPEHELDWGAVITSSTGASFNTLLMTKQGVILSFHFSADSALFLSGQDSVWIARAGAHTLTSGLLMLSSTGKLRWYKTFEGIGFHSYTQNEVLLESDWFYLNGGFSFFMDSTVLGSFTVHKKDGENFIIKMDTLGNLLLAKNIPLHLRLLYGNDHRWYSFSYFQDSVEINGNTHHAAYDDEAYLTRLNSSGGFDWFSTFPLNKRLSNYYLTQSRSNRILLASAITSAIGSSDTAFVVFENDTIRSTDSSGTQLRFIAAFKDNGEMEWLNAYGNQYSGIFEHIAVDDDNNILVAGHYHTFASLNGALLYGTAENSFLAKLDSNGYGIWAKNLSQPQPRLQDVASDGKGNIYAAFNLLVDGILDTVPVSESSSNGKLLLAHFRDTALITGIGDKAETPGNALLVYPNPATDFVYLVPPATGNRSFEMVLYGVTGNVIQRRTFRNPEEIRIDLSGLSPAVYYLSLSSSEKTWFTKVVKIGGEDN